MGVVWSSRDRIPVIPVSHILVPFAIGIKELTVHHHFYSCTAGTSPDCMTMNYQCSLST